MEDIRVDDIVKLQEICHQSDIPKWIKYEMDYLVSIVIKRANENNGFVDGVILYYPADYNNYNLFLRFAKMFKCSLGVVSANGGRYIIYNIGRGYSYIILDKSLKKANEEADRRYGKKGRKK